MSNGNILAHIAKEVHRISAVDKPTDIELVAARILRACLRKTRQVRVRAEELINPGTIVERLRVLGYEADKTDRFLHVKW